MSTTTAPPSTRTTATATSDIPARLLNPGQAVVGVAASTINLFETLAQSHPELLTEATVTVARDCQTYPGARAAIVAADHHAVRRQWAHDALAAAAGGKALPGWEAVADAALRSEDDLILALRRSFEFAWWGQIDQVTTAFAADAPRICATLAASILAEWATFAEALDGYPAGAEYKSLVQRPALIAHYDQARESAGRFLALCKARADLAIITGYSDKEPRWPLVLADAQPQSSMLRTRALQVPGHSPASLHEFRAAVQAAGGLDITPEPRPDND